MDLPQIFEYAIDQEISALEFYERSAAQTENAEAAALFRSLARMEAGHRRALENERDYLAETGQMRKAAIKKPTPEAEQVQALERVAEVLREANVVLKTKARKLETDVEMAAQIQSRLLPRKVPQLPGLEMSVACSMAERVGGDYYDFMITPAGNIAMTIADVSGKGMPAALLMVAVRTLWRAKIRDGLPPHIVLNSIGEDVSAELTETDQFVTMISGLYDETSSTFSFSNAGHWPPILLRHGADDLELFPPGFLPLGMNGEGRFHAHEIEFPAGDLIVLFSDGIIDAMEPGGQRFGEDRLHRFILDNRHLTAEALRDGIVAAVNEFTGGRQVDDQTLMILKRT